MLCQPLVHTYKRSHKKKKNKKRFKILEKGKYVDRIFEAFVGIADDLAMNDDEYL